MLDFHPEKTPKQINDVLGTFYDIVTILTFIKIIWLLIINRETFFGWTMYKKLHWLVEFDSMASVRCVVVIVKLYESWYWNVMLDSDVCQLVKQKEYFEHIKSYK